MRTDFQDRAFLVGRILGQKQDLHVLFQGLDPLLGLRQFHIRKLAHLAVGRPVRKHGPEVGDFGKRLLVVADRVHDRLQLGILRGELDVDVGCRTFRHARLDLAEAALQFAHFFDRKLRHPCVLRFL
jgi:hypothetical protein